MMYVIPYLFSTNGIVFKLENILNNFHATFVKVEVMFYENSVENIRWYVHFNYEHISCVSIHRRMILSSLMEVFVQRILYIVCGKRGKRNRNSCCCAYHLYMERDKQCYVPHKIWQNLVTGFTQNIQWSVPYHSWGVGLYIRQEATIKRQLDFRDLTLISRKYIMSVYGMMIFNI